MRRLHPFRPGVASLLGGAAPAPRIATSAAETAGAALRVLLALSRRCSSTGTLPNPTAATASIPLTSSSLPTSTASTSAVATTAASAPSAVSSAAAAAADAVAKADPTAVRQYWFSSIERRITPSDPAMEQLREILLNPTDPTAPAPPNLSPMPQIGTPPGGLLVQGPHELANPPFQASPLMLAEEVIRPPKLLSEMELLMKAWSEEFARAYFIFTIATRFLISVVTAFLVYFYYRTVVRIERIRRGADNQPRNLRVGCVVYFDMHENGRPLGRIVIGLLNENCPLYCEYFHRRCTGSGGDGNTFRGMRVKCMAPQSAVIFGDGMGMTHDVPGYNPRYLPTEWLAPGPWRGACMSVPYASNQESPNFAMLLNAGDYTPNVFGIVVAGFDVLEKMASGGITHGCDPRSDYTIEGCGELCTLDKAAVQPMPWRLYESVSKGLDTDKFGPRADWRQLLEGLAMTKEKLAERSWLTKLLDT
jgi:hypothetical protein